MSARTHERSLMEIGKRVSANQVEHVCGECGKVAVKSDKSRLTCDGAAVRKFGGDR